jgi:uncharacterized protein (UPF0335 family)
MREGKRRRETLTKKRESVNGKKTFGDDLAKDGFDSNVVETVYKARHRDPTL